MPNSTDAPVNRRSELSEGYGCGPRPPCGAVGAGRLGGSADLSDRTDRMCTRAAARRAETAQTPCAKE
ncbi:hypothetical protein GCM10018793_55630 [Streptomyces sulfonofaciens]|uniref:Uncharacterized protein n=1 Tax=Streptomyces sulfonofaciens TaxID=68272 RepID=A0A919GJY6_9ACTN|nr:hypothetical protein GCM10018793_55630 [Streptomyces sulfonofaciens]